MPISTPLTAPSLPTTPVWVGSSALQESPDSPQISLSKEGLTYTKIFTGPFATIEAAMPVRFAAVTGVPTGLGVDMATIKNGPGGVATLTIVCCQSPSQGIGETPIPIEEIEWVEVQRPLKSHKMFQADGVNELDDGDLSDLVAWQNQDNSAQMKIFKFPTGSGATDTLSDNATVYAKKWLRGQEYYNEYAPVYKKTLTLGSAPYTGGCGIIEAPVTSETTVPPYYQWLKNADRSIKRSRTYERVQEWLGAWWWDPDIYSTATTRPFDG